MPNQEIVIVQRGKEDHPVTLTHTADRVIVSETEISFFRRDLGTWTRTSRTPGDLVYVNIKP